MKHFFILNTQTILSQEASSFEREMRKIFGYEEKDVRLHVSRFPRDAIGVIRDFADRVPKDEKFRVYAVGGDGTVFDCLNGIIGLPNAELSAVTIGRSHDAALSFGENRFNLFGDLEYLKDCGSTKVDVIKSDSNTALNYFSIGCVAKTCNIAANFFRSYGFFKPKSKLLSRIGYRLSAYFSYVHPEYTNQHYKVEIDGVKYDGRYSFIHIANGGYIANGYCVVPHAKNNDGLLDIVMLPCDRITFSNKPVTDFFTGKFEHYTGGTSVENTDSKDIFIYIRAKRASITSDSTMLISMDGENFFDDKLNLKIEKSAIDFVAPDA